MNPAQAGFFVLRRLDRQVQELKTTIYRQKMRKVAYKVAGCFHDIAAREYFKGEDVETIPCSTFRKLFDTVKGDLPSSGLWP